MNISREPRFTRRSTGQAIVSGLAVVAVQGIFSLAGLGVPDRAAAQVAIAPITFGQNVSGALTSTDSLSSDGRPRDRYRLVTQAPNTRYVITVRSPAVPLVSEISFVNVNLLGDPASGLQTASNFAPGQQIQYSGTLAQPGQYLILVRSGDVQRPVGSYTLSLTGGPPAP